MQKPEILLSFISSDKNVIYGVFCHEVTIDSETSLSYGITAAETGSNCVSVYDVYTDYDKIIMLTDTLKSRSVPPHMLKAFIIDHVS